MRWLAVTMMVAACAGAPAGQPADDSDVGLPDREFVVEGIGRLRLITNPYWKKDVGLNDYGRLCRDRLGEGWRIAPGSYHPSFLDHLGGKEESQLLAFLDRHGIEFAKLDRVCAPCVPDAAPCPCTDRWVSDKLFCLKQK